MFCALFIFVSYLAGSAIVVLWRVLDLTLLQLAKKSDFVNFCVLDSEQRSAW